MAESLVGRSPDEFIEAKGDGVFECLLCAKQYKSRSFAKRHFQFIHQDLKEMVCKVVGCTKAYGNYSSLRRHVAREHGDAMMACPNASCPYESVDLLRLVHAILNICAIL